MAAAAGVVEVAEVAGVGTSGVAGGNMVAIQLKPSSSRVSWRTRGQGYRVVTNTHGRMDRRQHRQQPCADGSQALVPTGPMPAPQLLVKPVVSMLVLVLVLMAVLVPVLVLVPMLVLVLITARTALVQALPLLSMAKTRALALQLRHLQLLVVLLHC